MTKSITVQRRFHVRGGPSNRQLLCNGNATAVASSRIARVSRLMALAIRFDQLIRDGGVEDQAELARLGHVSRARLTQIMNLLNLAPDIQEDVLNEESVAPGRNVLSERQLRPIAKAPNWQTQRRLYSQMISYRETT